MYCMISNIYLKKMKQKEDYKLLLKNLSEANDSLDYEAIRKLLTELVPGFEPGSQISDILHINLPKLN